MNNTVMMFGIGSLGGWVLEFLARSEGINTIVACDAREDWGSMKTECAAIGAGQQGYNKTIKFEKCDVNDTDATAELIKKHNPDIIYSALTLLAWADWSFISDAIGLSFHRSMACHTPAQLVMASKLMKARKKAGITAPVLNNSFPDVVNPVLWRNGLGPMVGAGNLDIPVSEVRRKISVAENVPIRDVTVYLITSHAIVPQGTKEGVPHLFKAMIGDKDITNKLDVTSLLSDTLFRATPADKAGWLAEPYIAASAVRNMKAFLNDTNEFAHSPGPNGLPGGYPIRIGSKGVKIELPEGISLEEAIKINLDSLKCDGIEEIKDDGTVVLTDEAYKVQREFYGMDSREYRFADMDDIAKELRVIVKKIAAKYG
ncbi:hypothetical protein ACFLXG_04670 [Chloroflexota bacterium]